MLAIASLIGRRSSSLSGRKEALRISLIALGRSEFESFGERSCKIRSIASR